MKKKLLLLTIPLCLLCFAFKPGNTKTANKVCDYGLAYNSTCDGKNSTIKWLSWQEAVELNKKNPKKLFVFVYAKWDGWSKKMDSTMLDKNVTDYLTQNFYCIKLDAETTEDIVYKGNTFKFVKSDQPAGKMQSPGVHELAYALLDGHMGYPTMAYLNDKMERILLSPGYKKPMELMPELEFVQKEIYLTQSWENYKNNGNVARTGLTNAGVKAQPGKFTIEDVMNKVKEFIPDYEFSHYNWPLPPSTSYGIRRPGPEEINVYVEFKDGIPVRILLKNMDIKDNPVHLSILTEVLKMADERYLGWFTEFNESAVKRKKKDSHEYKIVDDSKRLNFEYSAETKKTSCTMFY